MAFAMVNNVALSPPSESFPWMSPRISFSYDLADPPPTAPPEDFRPDADASAEDFQFLLHDPVAMLPADKLFSCGKLVPLKLAAEPSAAEMGSPEPTTETPREVEIAGSDPCAFSPRAPRCTTLWRELLGLKRARGPKPAGVQVAVAAPPAAHTAASKNPNPRSSSKLLLLRRNPKPASLDSSLSLPLLRHSDHQPAAITSLPSLSSSSSSCPDHDDLARLSIDSDKPNHAPPRVRLVRPRPAAAAARAGRSPTHRTAPPPPPRGESVDSPRMSSSGKIVFRGLERSSSSPGSFTGGPRPPPRGVQRSYSANIPVVPVLNVVPVRSLRGSGKPVSVFGFAHFFSPQKKDRDGSAPSRVVSVQRQRRQDKIDPRPNK